MERILVVNVNWVGDVLFSTPLIRAIKQKYLDARVSCMVVPRCAQVLEGNPHLDELIIYDEDGPHKGIAGKLNFVSELRKKGFDEAIILHRSFTRTLLVALAKVPRRMGYYTKKRSLLLTDKPVAPQGRIHRIDMFCELGERLGIEVKDRIPEFHISDEDRRYVRELLESAGIGPNERVVVLNPGGNWLPKRWPKENFAALAKALAGKFGVKIVISGAKKDEKLADDIARLSGIKTLSACGKTNLKQLGALMERASLVISNDSGPAHVAAAMGTKVMVLFGPTSPEITAPRGKNDVIILHKNVGCKIPCYSSVCKDNRCMKAISVEDVSGAAAKTLNS